MRWMGIRGVLAMVLAMPVVTSPAARAQSHDGLQPEVLDTLLRMRVIAAVLDTHAIEHPYPAPAAGLVPVSSVLGPLGTRVRGLDASMRDGWSGALLYWSDGRHYLVLSLGADGTKEFAYDGVPPWANIPKGWAGSDSTNDLLLVDGVVYRGPASQSEFLRRAMGELRSLGTACESFAVDTNLYPGPVDPTDLIGRVASDLEPIYIRSVPRVDPWGNPYRFWSDTRLYALVSYGPDGIPDYPYASWGRVEYESLDVGPTTRFGQDLVFVSGRFVQWPAIGDGP